MRYEVLSGGPTKTAGETVVALQRKVNEAVSIGAVLVGGISVVFWRAPGFIAKDAHEAFQAVTYPDQ
ncbi:hypothetical protein [Burkholderia cenocepacia]|uniref:hypothetical protein n=1 Tax=Burkholderia cenocepacia TaxID=95486 RepID=UPI000F5A16EE|nr:hypothetical protein [Burkholderia cenocepacia]